MKHPGESPSPYCLALTGGIACGKSTVGEMLEEMGLDRVDSDQVSRLVVAPGSYGLSQVAARFGERVLTPGGELDRRAMAEIVFADPKARQELEAILHPLIWEKMSQSMERAQRERRETVFEIPLLFEKGSQTRFSTVWVVGASPAVQIQRLIKRDGLTKEQAQARLDAQMSVQEKARMADYVLLNDGDHAQLQELVERGVNRWRAWRTSVESGEF